MTSHAALRTKAIIAVFVAFAIVVAASIAIGHAFALSGAFGARARGLFGLICLIVLARIGDSHPYAAFGPANLVTTARAAGVALVVALIGERASADRALLAIAVATAVTLGDGADGWLARRTKMESAFGARFDMEMDALLILALSVLAWQYGKAGAWIVLSGALRYLFVAAGWTWAWMRRPLPPRFRRKTVCVVQIVALLVALLPPVMPPASTAIAAASLALLAWSFAVDTWWLWQERRGGPETPALH